MWIWMVLQAYALDCLWGAYDFNVTLADDVPTDVQIVANTTYSGEPENTGYPFELVHDDGTLQPVDVHWGGYFLRITPTADLKAGGWMLTGGLYYDYAVTFSVGSPTAPSLDAPTGLDAERTRSTSDWGEERGITLTFDEVTGASHYEIEMASDDGFTDAVATISPYRNVFLGDGLCGSTIDDYQHDVTKVVRVRAVDLSGNTSAFSDPIEVQPGLLDRLAPGCSTTAGVPWSASLLGLLVGVVGWRRRQN